MIGGSISATIEVLTPIWERVLQRSTVGTEDNFFDSGGDPASAERFFAEIGSVCGREFSPLVIFQAPTIASLAALLGQAQPVPVAPLLPLNSGTGNDSPPIFVAHGLGDTVMSLFQLVRRWGTSHPVYGMQARGVDGLTDPISRVEEMAHYHLQAIQRLQPCGPYFLIGYSLGGLVALEIAQCLSRNGEKIGLLAMLDSYPDRHHLSLGQRARLEWRLAKGRAASLLRAGGHQLGGEDSSASASEQHQSEGSIARAMQRVKDEQYRALRSYRPRFYDGKVRFVRAAIPSYFPEDPVAVWGRLVRELEVETMPGNHLAMLTTQVETLASIVARYVEEAAKEK